MTSLDKNLVKLKEGSEEDRAAACRELIGRAGNKSVGYLIDALEDTSPLVRAMAEEGLIALGPAISTSALVAQLPQVDVTVRNRMAAIVAEMGGEAIPYLAGALKSGNADVRICAAVVLRDIGGKGTVKILLEALSDPQENVRYAAAEALGASDSTEVIPALMRIAASDAWACYPAILSLGKLGALAAVPLLHDMVDNDEWRRYPAIIALGDIGSCGSEAILLKQLRKGSDLVKQASLTALAKCGRRETSGLLGKTVSIDVKESLATSLTSSDKTTKLAAIVAAGWAGGSELYSRVVVQLGSDDQEIAIAAREALTSIAERFPDDYIRFVSAVDSPRPEMVAIAASLLPDRDVHDLLIRLLGHEYPEIRQAAVRALGEKGTPESAKVIAALLNDRNGDVRKEAALCLGNLGLEEFGEKLTPLLADGYGDVRRAAASALASIGGVALLGRLAGFLRSPTTELRESSVVALSSLARDIDVLMAEALQNPDVKTRRMAAGLLLDRANKELAPYAMRSSIDEDAQVRRLAIETLGKVAYEPAFAVLIAALADNDLWVRFAAISAVGQVAAANPRLRGVALGRLASLVDDGDDYLKIAALRALGLFADKRAASTLRRLLNNDNQDIRAAACEALAGMRGLVHPDVVEPLLRDPSYRVQSAAVRALAKLGGWDARATLRDVAAEESVAGSVARELLGEMGDKVA